MNTSQSIAFVLFLVALFGIWGLVGGGVLLVVLLVTTRTPTGHSYLYPVIPFNYHDFKYKFLRLKIRSKEKKN